MPQGRDGRPFTIVQLSDLHCGQQFFLPDLLERAIAEVNELAPDVVVISGDLTSHGFKEEYARRARVHRRDRVQVARRDPRQPRLAERRLRPLRGAVRRPQLGAARRRTTIVAVDSTEPDLDNGQIGRGRYGWIEEQFADACRPARLRPPPPSAARPRHGARAQHRQRRRRCARVPAARGRRPRALRAQARPVRLAARGSIHRERRHGLVVAAQRQRAALLQRRRGRRDARVGLAASIRSTTRSGSSSSRRRRRRTRSTRRASRAR